MSSNDYSDFVIVGGVAAGPKTAATLARRLPRASITLFQKEKHLSYASCGLPYFASGDISSFDELTRMPWGTVRNEDFFRMVKGFCAITGAEVTAIDRGRKVVTVQQEDKPSAVEHGYGKLVLATGARPAPPAFPVEFGPRVQSFTRPENAIEFRRLAETGQVGSAAVIGGGYIGCEMAEALGGLWGINTAVLEKEQHVLPATLDPEMAVLVERELKKQDIDLRTGVCVEKITSREDGATVYLSGGETLEVDFVIVCTGVAAEVTLARACGLTLGVTGAIAVDEHFRTSDPDIFAGGDCVELTQRITGEKVHVPLGSLANRHGWVIAENLAGNEIAYPGVLGSYLVKVFDVNLGGVGLNWAVAQRFAPKPAAVWGTFVDRPDYYPESKTITLKMIFDQQNGRLLGLQGVGGGEIARRIDVFSVFLRNDATIDDLLGFEPGYAPPFSEAVDPLHHLAGMARATSRGVVFINPGEFGQLSSAGVLWLDVREPVEQEELPFDLPEVVRIPLDRLRAEASDLPRDRKIVIICQRGSRAYQAAVFLKDAGFDDVVILSGGRAALG
ncbi:FAD-dependent oxidoreductase [Candidatus Zixiibacteriota bacterium]